MMIDPRYEKLKRVLDIRREELQRNLVEKLATSQTSDVMAHALKAWTRLRPRHPISSRRSASHSPK